jgi:hypothetical protein
MWWWSSQPMQPKCNQIPRWWPQPYRSNSIDISWWQSYPYATQPRSRGGDLGLMKLNQDMWWCLNLITLNLFSIPWWCLSQPNETQVNQDRVVAVSTQRSEFETMWWLSRLFAILLVSIQFDRGTSRRTNYHLQLAYSQGTRRRLWSWPTMPRHIPSWRRASAESRPDCSPAHKFQS